MRDIRKRISPGVEGQQEGMQRWVTVKKNRISGFTLLEIVIVLTIIGFLLAMIAPRLGSIGESSVETIDESNIKSMRGYVMLYQQQKNRLPNKPVTIVNSKPGGTYQRPLVDDGEAENGPETIGSKFDERCRLRLHILNKEEADEIKQMGIRKMAVLNDHVGSTNEDHKKDGEDSELVPQSFANGDDGRPFNLVDVEEGVGVLMVGAGADRKDAKIKADVSEDEEMGNPDWLYRIVLGIGQDSALVSEGMVQNEGLSPRGMQNKDYNTFNNYSLVMPRLKATVDRIAGGEPKEFTVADSRFDKDDEKAVQRLINTGEDQKLWQVDVTSPLGYKWPRDEAEKWRIQTIKSKF